MVKMYPIAHEQVGGFSDRWFVRTGEKRPPKQGEWYLSGAMPEAWQTPNDLSSEYHILVEVQAPKKIQIGQFTYLRCRYTE